MEPSANKPIVSLVVCGHVDAGKSTLIGNLLFNLGLVDKRYMHKCEQDSKRAGKGSFAFAWVMDEGTEERNRGVTIDIIHRQIETELFIVNVIDAPGHKDFVPNMITGATQADAALLVVDCGRGEFESGFADNGQTKEHLILVKSLGVNQIIVAANKMDVVEWSKDRYLEIQSKLRPFLKTLDFKDDSICFVPCSGISGENVHTPIQHGSNHEWCLESPTLLQAIDRLKVVKRSSASDTVRFFVSDAFKFKGSSVGCSGRLEVGNISVSDSLTLMPGSHSVQVKEISINEQATRDLSAGQFAIVTLSGLTDCELVSSGAVLCNSNNVIGVGILFSVRLLVLGSHPIVKGLPITFHYKSVQQPAQIISIISQIDRSTGKVIKNNPRVLVKKMAGVLTVKLQGRPICAEIFSTNKDLSRCTLRAGGETLATGVLTDFLTD